MAATRAATVPQVMQQRLHQKGCPGGLPGLTTDRPPTRDRLQSGRGIGLRDHPERVRPKRAQAFARNLAAEMVLRALTGIRPAPALNVWTRVERVQPVTARAVALISLSRSSTCDFAVAGSHAVAAFSWTPRT